MSREACEVTFCSSWVIFWLRKRLFWTYERHPIVSEGISVASSAKSVILLLMLCGSKGSRGVLPPMGGENRSAGCRVKGHGAHICRNKEDMRPLPSGLSQDGRSR